MTFVYVVWLGRDVWSVAAWMVVVGSKQGSAVASAAVSGDKILVKRLPNNASIFSAESSAILLALDVISQTSNAKFLKDLQNSFIVEILERLHELLSTGVCITFVWVPSHIGIAGNTAADAMAKAGLCLQISNSLIPYSDLKPLITSHLNNCWQQSWSAETNNKLHRIQIHFLVSCSKHELVRRKYLNVSTLDNIFTKVSPRAIVVFIKEIRYYH
jgi:hypothetical protein